MSENFEIAFDGALLRGEAAGFGLPVVFLHAGVADRRMWEGQMRLLAEEGFGADVRLSRTQTIMQGASHCDFRYALERSEKDGR